MSGSGGAKNDREESEQNAVADGGSVRTGGWKCHAVTIPTVIEFVQYQY
jgi:hypothetical protein